MDFLHFGSCVLPDPFRQLLVLDGIREGHQDLMEELQGFISFQQIRDNIESIAELLEIVVVTGAPVFLLVKFFRLQETGNAFDLPVAFHVAGILETALVTQADIIHHVIKTLDDMEGIDADFCDRESLLRHRYKTVAHVAAEIFYLFPLIQCELEEIFVEVNTGDLVKDINYSVGITIGDVAVVLIAVPSVMPGTPDAAVPFKLVYAERFRETARKTEMDGFKDGLDQALCNMIPSGDFGEGNRGKKIQKDGIIESLCHAKGRVDPVRSLIERGTAGLTEQPAFVKSDYRTTVIVRDVSYCLVSTRVFNDAVVGTAMRAEPLLWQGDIEGNEVVAPADLNVFDGSFLWISFARSV